MKKEYRCEDSSNENEKDAAEKISNDKLIKLTDEAVECLKRSFITE